MIKNKLIIMLLFFSIYRLFCDEYSFENNSFYYPIYEKYEFNNGIISRYFDKYAGFDNLSKVDVIFSESYELTQEGNFTIIDYLDLREVVLYNENLVLLYLIEDNRETHHDYELYYTFLTKYSPKELWLLHNISASSYLTEKIREKEVSYPPQNLENDDIQEPWVEGAEGSGIGSYLQIDEGGWGVDNLVFVNGFFHPQKRYLYEYNNRVKKFLLESTDDEESYEMEINLEDTPNFQTFLLPRYTKNFKLTIKEVYKGTKYDDTCISGLFSDFTLKDVKKND